jgi:hypothetical protein
MHMCRTFIGALLGLLLSTAVAAQVRAVPFPAGQGRGVGGRATPIPADQIGMVAIEPLDSARPVTGSPYTADAVTETTQVLADGNRIERRTTASVARDSKGRVRREQQDLPLGGLVVESPLVTISDPVAGTHTTLDSQRHVAFRARMLPASAAGRGRSPAARGGPPDAVDVKTERLGERDIEGVRAEGVRTTTTIPINAIGNQAPITTVSERWFAQELQAIVLTRRSDPRFGDTVYRLVNIVRAEPPASLFDIPGDYRIEEQTPRP